MSRGLPPPCPPAGAPPPMAPPGVPGCSPPPPKRLRTVSLRPRLSTGRRYAASLRKAVELPVHRAAMRAKRKDLILNRVGEVGVPFQKQLSRLQAFG
mmetsp:Transcript_35814/g.70524  ORF Transcript_35814/g.70524 Transcript_35814/m.70524 type:complete len:97 (-) Transcript_35814:100-390(-)